MYLRSQRSFFCSAVTFIPENNSINFHLFLAQLESESKSMFLITSFTPKSLANCLARETSKPTYLVFPFSLVCEFVGWVNQHSFPQPMFLLFNLFALNHC